MRRHSGDRYTSADQQVRDSRLNGPRSGLLWRRGLPPGQLTPPPPNVPGQPAGPASTTARSWHELIAGFECRW